MNVPLASAVVGALPHGTYAGAWPGGVVDTRSWTKLAPGAGAPVDHDPPCAHARLVPAEGSLLAGPHEVDGLVRPHGGARRVAERDGYVDGLAIGLDEAGGRVDERADDHASVSFVEACGDVPVELPHVGLRRDRRQLADGDLVGVGAVRILRRHRRLDDGGLGSAARPRGDRVARVDAVEPVAHLRRLVVRRARVQQRDAEFAVGRRRTRRGGGRAR